MIVRRSFVRRYAVRLTRLLHHHRALHLRMDFAVEMEHASFIGKRDGNTAAGLHKAGIEAASRVVDDLVSNCVVIVDRDRGAWLGENHSWNEQVVLDNVVR